MDQEIHGQRAKFDLNDRTLYPVTPSPLSQDWIYYIQHRMKMLKSGMAAYATAQYARLGADKHIESQRAIDRLAGNLVNNGPSLIFIGNVDMAPNSPIRIKKHMRCPGLRKLINAFKKRSNCVVIPVDEYFTSQTCAKCYGRFDRNTRSHCFKVCLDCRPATTEMLPSLIVSKTGKRDLQGFRKMDRIAQRHQLESVGLHSKVILHHKKWMVNPVTDILEYVVEGEDEMIEEDDHVRKTVWNRDIVAAKCILVKGDFYFLFVLKKKFIIESI